MKSVITAAALAALAGSASADILSATASSYDTKTFEDAGVLPTAGPRAGLTYDFDVGGIESWDLVGDSSNTVIEFDLAAALGLASGTSIAFNGIGWDVTISTVGASWLSEARIYFDDNISPDLVGLFLSPGIADGTPGTGSYSSGGILKLADAGIDDVVLPNGILRMEFNESFDDVADAVDAIWSGTLTLQAIPAPGTLALLGLGGFAAARRRR